MSVDIARPEGAQIVDADSFAQATGASDAEMADLAGYLGQLSSWNEKLNLVGPSALAAFWGRHAFDSWQLLALAPGASRWADLGTGAGLPGVILAIFLKERSGAQVHLVDSLAKRCRFLAEVVAALDLPAVVHNVRAESLSLDVDVVAARACAPLEKLFGYARPYVERGATGLFLKGETAEAELATAAASWDTEAELIPSLSDPRGRVVRIRRLHPRARPR